MTVPFSLANWKAIVCKMRLKCLTWLIGPLQNQHCCIPQFMADLEWFPVHDAKATDKILELTGPMVTIKLNTGRFI